MLASDRGKGVGVTAPLGHEASTRKLPKSQNIGTGLAPSNEQMKETNRQTTQFIMLGTK